MSQPRLDTSIDGEIYDILFGTEENILFDKVVPTYGRFLWVLAISFYDGRIANNGEKTLFWKGSLVNNSPLANQFPRLYNVTFSKNVAFSRVKDDGWVCKISRE